MAAVELHMISDSTGETAQRLVQALEAQFPGAGVPRDQASARRERLRPAPRGRPDERALGCRRLHARRARAARRDAVALPEREAALLRPARPSDRSGRAGVGAGGEDEAARAAAAQRCVLPAHVGDRVRRQVRRRSRLRPCRCGHRPRRRLAHLEDAAVDLSRVPRLQDRERSARQGHRSTARPLHDRPVEGRRADDRRPAPVGDPRGANPVDARRPQVRRPRRDLRRARLRRRRCTGGSAARCSRSASCRSRRSRTASSSSWSAGRPRSRA